MSEKQLSSTAQFHFFKQFHQLSGHHLEHYKDIETRLLAYLQRSEQQSLDALIECMSQEPEQIKLFLDFLTINTSEFFRNPERFQELKLKIMPLLFSRKKKLRIWSAGCANGAEPFSLSILLSNIQKLEYCQIIGSDLDQFALQAARSAEYPVEQLKNVSLADLNYYFDLASVQPRRYRLKSDWQKQVLFQHHDLLSPKYPQSFDLITCRNVMIYFNRDTKYQVYRKFYEALNDYGVLFIGGAEQLFDIQGLGYKPISPYFLQKLPAKLCVN